MDVKSETENVQDTINAMERTSSLFNTKETEHKSGMEGIQITATASSMNKLQQIRGTQSTQSTQPVSINFSETNTFDLEVAKLQNDAFYDKIRKE